MRQLDPESTEQLNRQDAKDAKRRRDKGKDKKNALVLNLFFLSSSLGVLGVLAVHFSILLPRRIAELMFEDDSRRPIQP